MSLGNPAVVAETTPAPALVNAPGRTLAVCHVASGDLWAGAEVQLAMLLRALKRNGNVRLLAILFNEGRLAEEARACGAEVHVLPESRMGFFRLAREVARLLRGRGVAVLHTHGYKGHILAALVAGSCGIRWVVRTQHGAPEPFDGWRRFKHAAVLWLDRVALRFSADRVIAVSGDLHGRLARLVGGKHLVTIHNGLELDAVGSALTPTEAKRRLGMAADALVVGTAGRLVPVKRLDIFLDAAARIAAERPQARFVIAGEGRELPQLREQAARLGLGEQVLFLGHRDDIHDVLRAMDVFVLCSDHEGLPMVLLEALYLGVPVAARPVGGIAEVTEDGRSAVWVRSAAPEALAETCLQLLADPELRARIAEAGRRRVAERFSADATAARTVALYGSLCNPGIREARPGGENS